MKKRTAQFLVVLLSCLTVSQVVKERNEDENIILSFVPERFNENCTFKIERNDDVIFCDGTLTDSGKCNSGLQNPALVKVETLHDNNIVVRLSIESLLRSDKGIYVCVFECPDDIQSKSYELDIIYRPGPATCTWGKGPNYISSFTLTCIAQSGNPSGTFLCFTIANENSFAHFPAVESVSQEEILAEFMIPREDDVSCCSVSKRFPKYHSDCRDFLTTPATDSPQYKQDNYPSTTHRAPAAGKPTKSINTGSISGASVGLFCTINIWLSVASLIFVLHNIMF